MFCFTLNLNTRDARLTDRSMISYIDIPDISAQRFSLARRRDFILSIRNKSARFSGQYGRITQQFVRVNALSFLIYVLKMIELVHTNDVGL